MRRSRLGGNTPRQTEPRSRNAKSGDECRPQGTGIGQRVRAGRSRQSTSFFVTHLDIWCDKMAENATRTGSVEASLEAIIDTTEGAFVPTWVGQTVPYPGMCPPYERGPLQSAGFEASALCGPFDRTTPLPHATTGLPAHDVTADGPRRAGRSNGARHEPRGFNASETGAVCETNSAEPFGRSVRGAWSNMPNQAEHSRTVAPISQWADEEPDEKTNADERPPTGGKPDRHS